MTRGQRAIEGLGSLHHCPRPSIARCPLVKNLFPALGHRPRISQFPLDKYLAVPVGSITVSNQNCCKGFRLKQKVEKHCHSTIVNVLHCTVFEMTGQSLDIFLECFTRHIQILDATVAVKQDFADIVDSQDNLRLVELPSWAGLGAVQYDYISCSVS